MKKLIGKIVHSILTGEDYRTYVLATINKRFIDKAQELTAEIFEYKRKGDNWLEKLLDETYEKKGKENRQNDNRQAELCGCFCNLALRVI